MLHHPTWSATLADQHRLALSHRANQRQLARSGAGVKPQRQRGSHNWRQLVGRTADASRCRSLASSPQPR
jgi:hypothetical protein